MIRPMVAIVAVLILLFAFVPAAEQAVDEEVQDPPNSSADEFAIKFTGLAAGIYELVPLLVGVGVIVMILISYG